MILGQKVAIMGLVQCKECKKPISDKATQCPHCGYKPSQSGCLAAIVFAVVMTAITSQCESKNSTSSTSNVASDDHSTSVSPSVNALSQEEINNGRGFPIPAACNYLSSMNGYTPNEYKSSSPDGNDYLCGTPYKNIGKPSNALLSNNIAYYVSGSKADVADTIKIIVNINQPKNVKQAREELSKAVNQLFLSAFEKSAPEKIINKISSGKDGSWTYGAHVITFKKIKWQGGKGFEYNFTLRI